MTDLRQTKEFARFLKSQGWIIERVNQAFVFVRKIPLTPVSIIKIQRPERIDFKKIDQLAKKHRALTIYLEPSLSTINYQLSTKEYGFRLSHSPFLPTKTIHLDLAQSESNLLAQMKKDVRYSLRKAKKGISLPAGKAGVQGHKGAKQIKKFHQAWKKSVGWRRHVPSLKTLTNLKSAFGPKAIFLTARARITPGAKLSQANENTPGVGVILAGTIILLTRNTAYYYYAFTSKEGRQKLAQYSLVWEATRLAKKQKCKIFDFEGVYDERFPIKNWQGFSHFKKSFGGKEVEYPGCYLKRRLLQF